MSTPFSYRSLHKPLTFEGGTETLLFGTIARRMQIGKWADPDQEPINLDPDYQRGHVWTDDQQEAFVGHLIEGGATPPVIMNRDASYKLPDEVVDGKQRITAVVRFIRGDIAAQITDGPRLYLRDFSEDDQRYIMGISGPKFTCGYVMLNRVDVMRLYLRLNRGGTVHTDEEISRVQGLLKEEASRKAE